MSTPEPPESQDSPDGRPGVPPPPPAPAPAYNPYAAWQQAGQPYPLVPPPPPRKSRAPLITGIVVGVLVVLCIGLVWAYNTAEDYMGDAPSDTSSGGPTYTLSVPRTLIDGAYTLTQDNSAALRKRYSTNPELATMTAMGGQYRTGSGRTLDILTFWGVAGRIPDPPLFRTGMLAARLPSGSAHAGGPKAFRPAGSDRTVNCEVLTETSSLTGRKLTMPTCVWDDNSVAIAVSRATPTLVREDPSNVDLQPLADLMDKVIDEVRVPAGTSGGTGS